jgi:hypothetical protein
MEPKQLELKPTQKQKSYQQQSLRRPQPIQHQKHYGPGHQKSLTQSQQIQISISRKEESWDIHHISATGAVTRPTDTNTHGHIFYEDRKRNTASNSFGK